MRWATSTAAWAPWGFARGGMGAIANALAGAFQEHGGEIKTDAGVAQIVCQGRTRERCRARERRRVPRRSRGLEPRSETHLPEVVGRERPRTVFRGEGAQFQDPRFVRQAEHRARRYVPGVSGTRQGQRTDSRRHAFHRFDRAFRTRVRRLEERHLVTRIRTSTC